MKLAQVYQARKEYEDARYKILLIPWALKMDLLIKLREDYIKKIIAILESK